MEKVFSFVSYYRLLGFDHVFFWRRPDIAQRTRFDEIKALPYVTLTEYTGGGEHDGQMVVEHACLSQTNFAANYTWAFPIDLDEYLWYKWREPIYKYIVHRLADFHYVSIGKYMYTQQHAVALERNDSGFGLDRYAFSAGAYCNGYPEYLYCPTWRGRAKILVVRKWKTWAQYVALVLARDRKNESLAAGIELPIIHAMPCHEYHRSEHFQQVIVCFSSGLRELHHISGGQKERMNK